MKYHTETQSYILRKNLENEKTDFCNFTHKQAYSCDKQYHCLAEYEKVTSSVDLR